MGEEPIPVRPHGRRFRVAAAGLGDVEKPRAVGRKGDRRHVAVSAVQPLAIGHAFGVELWNAIPVVGLGRELDLPRTALGREE